MNANKPVNKTKWFFLKKFRYLNDLSGHVNGTGVVVVAGPSSSTQEEGGSDSRDANIEIKSADSIFEKRQVFKTSKLTET